MKEDDGLFADPGSPTGAAPRATATKAPRVKPAHELDEPMYVPTLSTDSLGREPGSVRTALGPMWVVVVALLALVFGAAGGVGGYALAAHGDKSGTASLPAAVANPVSAAAVPGSVTSVVAAVLPSVVRIEAESGGTTVDTGSGFIIRQDGYILTNNHVVAPSDGHINVRFSDGTVSPATIVGTTGDYDLAVLKVDKTGLTPLVFADSSKVQVGDQAIAIGSPLGLDSTVTLGIVSALHRPVTAGTSANSPAFIDAIQTDAAINPGNSGGPLLSASGQVIGINSATAALPGASQVSGSGTVGLGFAIPSNQARRTADQLITTGKATYPVIGVLLDSAYTGEGVKVLVNDAATNTVGVVPGSPADKAGIKAGDIILSINGRPVTMPEELVVAVRSMAPGDTVDLQVKAGSSTSKVVVTLVANDQVTWNNTSKQ